ncbi:MAG: hypothetical protein ACYDH6_19230 [Acidimicrobiales bacterium]
MVAAGYLGNADLPGFEVFTRRRYRPDEQEPWVTIQKAGGISFNNAAFEALGEPKAIELLFNRKQRILGVRSVDSSVPHAYKVQAPGGGKRDKGFIISGRSFMAFYGIEQDEARRRKATVDSGTLYVDLNEPGVVVTSNRTGRTSKTEATD